MGRPEWAREAVLLEGGPAHIRATRETRVWAPAETRRPIPHSLAVASPLRGMPQATRAEGQGRTVRTLDTLGRGRRKYL